MNWQEFFAMGGYAFYVWSSWGITAIVMLLLVINTRRKKSQLLQQFKAKQRRAELLQTTSNTESLNS